MQVVVALLSDALVMGHTRCIIFLLHSSMLKCQNDILFLGSLNTNKALLSSSAA